MGGGGADHAVSPQNILRPVTDADMDAIGDQLIGGDGRIHIRPGNMDAHALKHQPQRTHGYAADADHMYPLPGAKILI